jgi:glycine cleavage system H protein
MKQIDKYQIRTDLYYDPQNHFWLDISGNKAIIGMSPLVQETSGSFVAIQLANAGTTFNKSESMGSVEAEKHVGPLKAPVSGKVIAVNEEVIQKPRLINDDPYGEGWIMEIELTNATTEIPELVSGEESITSWFESEIKKFDEKGWIAQP